MVLISGAQSQSIFLRRTTQNTHIETRNHLPPLNLENINCTRTKTSISMLLLCHLKGSRTNSSENTLNIVPIRARCNSSFHLNMGLRDKKNKRNFIGPIGIWAGLMHIGSTFKPHENNTNLSSSHMCTRMIEVIRLIENGNDWMSEHKICARNVCRLQCALRCTRDRSSRGYPLRISTPHISASAFQQSHRSRIRVAYVAIRSRIWRQECMAFIDLLLPRFVIVRAPQRRFAMRFYVNDQHHPHTHSHTHTHWFYQFIWIR